MHTPPIIARHAIIPSQILGIVEVIDEVGAFGRGEIAAGPAVGHACPFLADLEDLRGGGGGSGGGRGSGRLGDALGV